MSKASVEGNDQFVFERRNKEALSMKMESIGKVWKDGKEKIVDFSGNVCVKRLADEGKPNSYLVIGFTEVDEDRNSGQKRIKWGMDDHIYKKGMGNCSWLKGLGGKTLNIAVDRFWNKGGRIDVWRQSLIALGYGKGIRVFSNSNNKNIVAIVLGVAVKKERWDSGDSKWVDDDSWKVRSELAV